MAVFHLLIVLLILLLFQHSNTLLDQFVPTLSGSNAYGSLRVDDLYPMAVSVGTQPRYLRRRPVAPATPGIPTSTPSRVKQVTAWTVKTPDTFQKHTFTDFAGHDTFCEVYANGVTANDCRVRCMNDATCSG